MNRLLIDASSILRACHYAGKDMEFGYSVDFEEKKYWINSSRWAADTFEVSLRAALTQTKLRPFQIVLVKDGLDSRALRRTLYPEYKAQRSTKPPELNKEFNEALRLVSDKIESQGGMVVWQDGYEADDTIAYLAQNLQGRKVIWSRDGDMLALRTAEVDVLLNDTLNPAAKGRCPAKYVHVYKALVGDSSDNIPGAKGFGEKAFEDFFQLYGLEGLDSMSEHITKRKLHTLDANVNEFKTLQKIIDAQSMVYISYACAKFYPERINTSREPLQIQMSLPVTTKTLASPKDMPWIIDRIKQSPFVALDIETSTPLESDKWAEKILAHSKGRRKKLVDVFGSTLSGMSLAFGDNLQYSVYMPVDHRDCPLWTPEQVMEVASAIPVGMDVAIHNTAFELPVLFNTWGCWLEGAVDTMIMKSYVDENTGLGLKDCAKKYFDYEQASYDTVTQGKKMNELCGLEVLDYACDDAVVTAALYNRLRFTMELEETWDVYLNVDRPAQYWSAESFINGVDFDRRVLESLVEEDDKIYDEAWGIVRSHLKSIGWEGSTYIPFSLTNASCTKAVFILTGADFTTSAKTSSGLIKALNKYEVPELLNLIASQGDVDEYLKQYFTGEPDFDPNKSAHLVKLMYETMGLPIRFRTTPTEIMRGKGLYVGNPQADSHAVDHALAFDLAPASEGAKCLLAIKKMKEVNTRRSLYYETYPLLAHWKDGKLHYKSGQCMTVTRRFAPNDPNIAQIPKRGEGKKVRGIFRAPKGFVWVSADFSAQELAILAFDSQDENLLACFVGDKLRDPHAITGASIAALRGLEWKDYDVFMSNLKGNAEVKDLRDLGKRTNFATSYGCKPAKLAKLLVISEVDAEQALNAKEAAYPGLVRWATTKACDARTKGYVKTFTGARRHLWEKITAQDKWAQLEAERQAGNFVIQGSAGEQVKLAQNEVCKRGLYERYRAKFVWPIHDQVDNLVAEEDLVPFVLELHKILTQPYGKMNFTIKSEIKIGRDFCNLVKVGTAPTRGKIEEVFHAL